MSKTFQNSQVPNIIQSFTGFKNRIINGDFSVWQRGESFEFSSDTQVNGYTADRVFTANQTDGKCIVSKSNIDGFNSVKFSVDTPTTDTTSDGKYWHGFYYKFEGAHLYDIAYNKNSIVISFLFKSNLTGTFPIAMRNVAAGDIQLSYVSTF